MMKQKTAITLPADVKYVLPLRLFMAGIGVRLDFSVETIEDIKMAVSEACAVLLSGLIEGSLTCEVLEEEGLAFILEAKGSYHNEIDDGISRIILESIADECTFICEKDRCTKIKVLFRQ
ncbi:MAG: hypothetical protein ACOX3W_02325 [Christensenellaceae bacterium]|jgi:hypothetical protein